MSTTLRKAYLKALGAIGVERLKVKNALGHNYICHIGDFLSELPFYNPTASQSELVLCASWLRNENKPVVYDVGANVGYLATQLAQMLAANSPQIYAFEPVPTTFVKLVQSIRRLGLQERVFPIAAAVLDDLKLVQLSYSNRDSLFAQISTDGLNARVGDSLAYAPGITLDSFYSATGNCPALLKIDVECSEVKVLRGARRLLSGPHRPAILFEFNPLTLSECGATPLSFRDLLSDYTLYYVDDFEGQKMPLGSPVPDVENIKWVCNLFAVPNAEGHLGRWNYTLVQTVSWLKKVA
jgi:FkbM family methyltransferase